MRRAWLTALALMAAAGLAACSGGTKDLFGRGKAAPDEFAVYSRAPLSLPPGYGDRPGTDQPLPTPGGAAERTSLVMPQDEARSALLGSAAANASNPAVRSSGGVSALTAPAAPAPVAASPGTLALLQRTGAMQANSDIRATINRETQLLAEADQSFIERLMFWHTPPAYGTVVDAAGETRRIQETQALGDPIVAGQTPTIERRPKALLQGIFN